MSEEPFSEARKPALFRPEPQGAEWQSPVLMLEFSGWDETSRRCPIDRTKKVIPFGLDVIQLLYGVERPITQ